MATVSTSQNLNAVTRSAGEDITINSGAVLTIDAQVPADVASLATNLGSVICITSGEFEVLNTSTTDPIVITLSANTKYLRFKKNGKIKTRGNSIELGTATGAPSQDFSFSSSPLDVIPYPSLVEVETASGSGEYLPYWVVPVAGYTQNWLTTEFAGNDYPVGRVLFWNLTTRQLTSGDGTNGNLLPTGAKLRIPNIYFQSASSNATPSSRSQIDLNPSGSLDMEWTAFSDRWYLSTSKFNQLRMVHCGWGSTFEATASNGSVELDHFSVIPDTEQITVNTDFDINQILGHCKLTKISAIVAGLPTGATRIRFGQLFDLDPMVSDILVARKDGITSSTDEAMIIQNVPAGTDFRRLYVAGGRVELTNIADVRFIECGVARSTGTVQLSTANTQAWALTNCTKLKFVSGGMAGPSVCRNQWLSVDSQSSEIQAFNLYFDCGDNSQGLVTSAGADTEFYNCQFPNIRTTGVSVDSPNTFLGSFTNVRNCKGSGTGTIVLEATQGGVYDIVCGTQTDVSTTFNGATTFAFANLVDKGLSATTGNVVVGPFGSHTELTFTNFAQLDQAGSIELFEIGDAFEVESYFDMHAITSFQNALTVFTYTEASVANNDTTTAPTGVDFEFRVRNPADAYGAYQALTPANLASAIGALSGYDSDVGLRMQIRATATSQDLTRLISQIVMPTNIDTNWVAPDAYLTIRGAEATDITTMYRSSDDAVIDTFTGSGVFNFLASPYFEQSAYFIRRNIDGFEIMRTRSAPQTVILGDNGFVDLFAGAQVQLAQSADVSTIKAIVEAYLDVTISSRLASASYVLPATPTNVSDSQTAIIAEVNANETKIDTLTTNLASKPTLAQIEASAVLAKEATGTAIKAKTDQLAFTGANVNAHMQAITDATITSAKLADNAITASKIASNAITSAKIASSAIGASQIASGAITNAKFATGAISTTTFVAGAVNSTVAPNLDTTISSRSTLTASQSADAVWDEAYSAHTTAGTFGKLMDNLRKANLAQDGSVTGNATTTSFDTDLSHPTGTHEHQILLFVSGALEGQSRPILTFTNGVNNTIVLQEALTLTPSVSDEFVILPQHVHPIADIQAGLDTKTNVKPAISL